MWPHKDGLGVQLSYGIDGNGILMDQVRMPRETGDSIPGFHKMKNSQISMVPKQTSSFNGDDLSMQNNYFPHEITKTLTIEANILSSTHVYDPTIGDMMQIHDVRVKNGNKYHKVIAFITGEAGTVLNVSLLKGKRTDLPNKHCLLPEIQTPTKIEFSEPIKQICFSTCEGLDIYPTFLLVRCESNVYILNCSKTSDVIAPIDEKPNAEVDSEIEISIIEEIKAKDLNNAKFADTQFNPWDFTQFAIVDVEGSFAVWSMNPRKKVINKLKLIAKDTHSLYDATELSHWKKICWSNDFKTFFIMSRSSFIAFDINKKTSRSLIISNSWSNILDYQRISKHAFLLTSKELIWLEVDSKVTRMLSWKHFLNDNDKSFKIHSSEIKHDTFLCLIYSQKNSLVYVYTFGLKEGNPVSLKDPYFIKCDRGLKQLQLIKLNQQFYQPFQQDSPSGLNDEEQDDSSLLGLIQIKTDLSITLDILDTLILNEDQDSYASNSENTTDNDSNSENSPWSELKRNKNKNKNNNLFKKIKKQSFQEKAITLLNIDPLPTEGGDIDLVQNYAYKLGNGVSGKISTQFESLIDMAGEIPPRINNLEEYDSMIEQLSSFYKEQKLEIVDFSHSIKFAPFKTGSKNIEELYKKLNAFYKSPSLSNYNQEFHIKEAAVYLGTSLLKVRSEDVNTNKLDETINEEITESAKLVQNVLDKWDIDLNSSWIATVPDNTPKQRFSKQPSYQLPQIKLSQTSSYHTQTQSQTQLKSQNFRSSQQSQHSQRSDSQKRLSQSQRKNKKKKKSGFA